MARAHRTRSSAVKTDVSLLDSGQLPVGELARLADREGRRPAPIYQVHRWFARRFSSAFRAIPTAARLTTDDDFWEQFYAGVDYSGLTVLDPFVGGGTSVVEAALLGASVVGVDIDPVACAITRFELRAGDVPDLHSHLDALTKTVGRRLARYYRTVGAGGEPRQVLHGFWVQRVRCGGCGCPVEAHPHYRLAFEAEGDRQWAFCRHCHRVHDLDKDADGFRCGGCRRQTTVEDGPVAQGRLTCPVCRGGEDLIDAAARSGEPPEWRLFALETVAPGTGGRSRPMTERFFQPATDDDRGRVAAARRALARRKVRGGWRHVPDRRIPAAGRADDRLTRYGYRRYRELFNPRQLLHLSALADAIHGLPDTVREAFALAFSDHLTTNCMLTQYAFGWRRLAPLFSIRAYRHVCRPVEVNPWLDGTGRGTFPNTVRQLQRAVAFAREPQVARLRGGFAPAGEPLKTGSVARSVVRGDSRTLAAVADRSVDLILTDPPYCDNIAYSELSDFYLPWLQGFGLVPGDGTGGPKLPANLAAQSRGQEAVAAFRIGLGDCFRQMRRVLKDGGRLVFSYQHRTGAAWEALAHALAAGGWQPVQVFPLLGNSAAGLHQHEGTILWDAVTVCRKGPPNPRRSLAVSDGQLASAEAHARRWASRLSRRKVNPFRRVDHDNLRRAALVAAALGMFGPADRSSPSRLLAEALDRVAAECPIPEPAMPQVTKQALSQFIRSGCERQLALNLYPDNATFRPERQALTMPAPQPPRPGLAQVQEAGDEWQAEKLHDLTQTFGPTAIVGTPTTNAANQVRYRPLALRLAVPHATPARFVVEAEFTVGAEFRQALGVTAAYAADDHAGHPILFAAVRPDIIQVLPPLTHPAAVRPDGTIFALPAGDARAQLRVIDIKLTARASQGYFAEVAYYSMALAAWLVDEKLDGQFVVVPEGAVWPGSHEASRLFLVGRQLANQQTPDPIPPDLTDLHARLLSSGVQPDTARLLVALEEDLEPVPFEVFAIRVRRFFQVEIPAVLARGATWSGTSIAGAPTASTWASRGRATPPTRTTASRSRRAATT